LHVFADAAPRYLAHCKTHKTPTQSQSRYLSGQRAKNTNAGPTHPADENLSNNLLKTSAANLCSTGRQFINLTNYVKIQSFKMDNLGNIIRKLREDKELPLRTVAAFLDINQAILSKIERGQRKPTREQVVKLAEYFKVKENDLLVAWLSDKLVYELEDEEVAFEALQVAEEKVAYLTFKKTDKKTIEKNIKIFFKNYGLVEKAWLFGSFARGEDDFKSDIDIMIEVLSDTSFSLFDLAEIKYQLEKIISKKIDVVMKDGVRPQVMERIKPDLKLVYAK